MVRTISDRLTLDPPPDRGRGLNAHEPRSSSQAVSLERPRSLETNPPRISTASHRGTCLSRTAVSMPYDLPQARNARARRVRGRVL